MDEDHRRPARRAAGRTSSARTRRSRDLLYAGTEFGLYASWDAGATWVSIRNNIPPVAVRDIAIHPRDNDIIVATHGRGIYILDDASPLQQLQTAVKADAYLFPVRPAIRWAGRRVHVPQRTSATGLRRTRQPGAWINVYLKTAPAQPVTITIADKAGKTVRTLRARGEAGVNRFAWNLRHDIPGEQAGAGHGRVAGTAGRRALRRRAAGASREPRRVHGEGGGRGTRS